MAPILASTDSKLNGITLRKPIDDQVCFFVSSCRTQACFDLTGGDVLRLKHVSEGVNNISDLILKMRSVTVNRTTRSIHLNLPLKTHFCKNRAKIRFLQPSFFSGKSDYLTELPLKNDGCKIVKKLIFCEKAQFV